MVIRVREAATSSEKMTYIMFNQETGILKTSRFFSFAGFYQRFFHYIQQARKSDKTQEAETTPQQSNFPDDDSSLLLFHPSKSEEHGMPDKAEKSQSNVPDDDSTLTPNHPQKCRKRGVPDKAEERRASSSSLIYGMAALVLFLLTFTAGVCPRAGNMCSDVQAMAVSKGKVAIACPLTSDVYQFEIRTIFIRHFLQQSRSRVAVLACPWRASQQNFSCSYKSELIGISSDRILASMPKDQLGNGNYSCHLVPPDEQTFTKCIICDPDSAKDVPTTNAPKALPTTLDLPESGVVGQYGGLVTAVVFISITVFCLLMVIAAMEVYVRKMSGTAALVLFLLTFTAGVCPVAGNMCDIQAMAASNGKVAIACPLTSDVYQTKQSIMIKYFNPLTYYPEDALECDWKPPEQAFQCMLTDFETELIGIKTDQVLARLPRNKWEIGSYRCQLVPADLDEPFTNCSSICDPDDPQTVPTAEASKTTGAPKPIPVTLGQRELGEPREKASAHSVDPKQQISDRRAGGQYGGLVAAVVMLSITVFFLLLAIAAMVVFFLHYRRTMKQADKRTPEETVRFTSGEETV